MIINHNVSAIYAHRVLKFTNWRVDKNIEKLASGFRINRAADDASGLAVSEKMRSQIAGMKQAVRNGEDGISFVQTTEGFLQEVQDMLHRVRVLSVQAANGVYTSSDRRMVTVEVSQLLDEINRISSTAQFNSMALLLGQFGRNPVAAQGQASMWFHVGPNENQRIRVYIQTVTAGSLGLSGAATGFAGIGGRISVATISQANSAIANLDQALDTVSQTRADLGAYQNRIEHTIKSLSVGWENLQAAESRIRDTDMAQEMVDFVKNQVLAQAGTMMLAQANLKTQTVLQLLG